MLLRGIFWASSWCHIEQGCPLQVWIEFCCTHLQDRPLWPEFVLSSGLFFPLESFHGVDMACNSGCFFCVAFAALYPWFGGNVFSFQVAMIHSASFPVVFRIIRIRYPLTGTLLWSLAGLGNGSRQLCDQSSGTWSGAKLSSYRKRERKCFYSIVIIPADHLPADWLLCLHITSCDESFLYSNEANSFTTITINMRLWLSPLQYLFSSQY